MTKQKLCVLMLAISLPAVASAAEVSSVRLKIKQNQLVIWWQRNASGGVWLQGA